MDKILRYAFLIRIGLAFVFLANALTAFFAPSEFIEIIGNSFIASILPISAASFAIIIGINDALVAILLFLNVGRKWVHAWAAIWIAGVIIIRGVSLDALEEAGFLFMALALALDKEPSGQKLST
jgi:hypothetical protein